MESSIPLMEDFYSLQGEGFHCGKPAYFIRLAGCDVGCVWCDVKDSWDADRHPVTRISEIITRAAESGSDIAVITGGEPAIYDLTNLTNQLRGRGVRTHIETSGTRPLIGKFDWVTVSPKKFKKPLDEVLALADELKVIVYNRSDLAWALEFVPMLRSGCKLYLQPEYSRKDEMIPLIINFIQNNTDWQISIQIHKILGIP